jgi:hypothetical protein
MKTGALAHEYVRDGLTRFVIGQYANGLPLAMMLGYVMDAKVTFAHERPKKGTSALPKVISLINKPSPTTARKPILHYA